MFITSPCWLVPSSLIFTSSLSSSLPLFRVVLLCLCLYTTLSHLFISVGFWFRVLAASSPCRGSHQLRHFPMKSSRSTARHWTNSARRSQNRDPLTRKRSFDQVVLRRTLAWTDPVNARDQAVLLGDCVLSKCKCLHVHAFLFVSFDPS